MGRFADAHIDRLDEGELDVFEALIEVPDEEMGALPTHPVVPRLSGTPGTLRTAAPRIGEHNEALLKPLLGAAEYDRLCQSGVISKGKKKK